MNTTRTVLAISLMLALGAGQPLVAAQKKEADSVYAYGRWAVLSPAAGGVEPYVATATPDAANNTRPEEPFGPDILALDDGTGGGEPPVDGGEPPVDGGEPPVDIAGFCEAGSACGYASYEHVEPSSSTEDSDGKVLARFSLETFPVENTGGTDVTPATLGGETGPHGARFTVTETGDENFPDVASVDVLPEDVDFYFGEGEPVVETVPFNTEGSVIRTTSTDASGIQEEGDFGALDTGSWADAEEIIEEFISADSDPGSEPFFLSSEEFLDGGKFAFGMTPTIDEMQSFAAGNVTAIYQGVVLDYNSAMTLQFDFGGNSFDGSFASENGFNGFDISGDVQGVNFVANDGGNAVTGSFFNGGEQAAGAVSNPSQLGVFSANHVAPELN